jgi:hypothetical protein
LLDIRSSKLLMYDGVIHYKPWKASINEKASLQHKLALPKAINS